ncbi:thiol-disulfide oxidoreductase DCC family protein [Salimicrobium halophilum]|uniref:Predicted thiol-disulfide oxidoreductase YuxK, DCC family n=1 Tax=Salimicrobium halophilum TaxID=86666 RepID=A0A1G8VCK2_9BACI|nr:DUF393 domain-containing protein [Salimicrobium halophilum]SDJ63587.1 Predicted thiol-disulfide oxidoreductase YuxK, DCC family [Salimicrobium halophilum]
MKKSVVLYDAECPLCIRTKKWVTLFDWNNRLLWLSLQQMEAQTALSSEKKQEIREQLHLYDPDRQEHIGYDAVTYICKECPLLYGLGRILGVPAIRKAGIPVYRYIANNRYRVGIHDCKDGSCSI